MSFYARKMPEAVYEIECFCGWERAGFPCENILSFMKAMWKRQPYLRFYFPQITEQKDEAKSA